RWRPTRIRCFTVDSSPVVLAPRRHRRLSPSSTALAVTADHGSPSPSTLAVIRVRSSRRRCRHGSVIATLIRRLWLLSVTVDAAIAHARSPSTLIRRPRLCANVDSRRRPRLSPSTSTLNRRPRLRRHHQFLSHPPRLAHRSTLRRWLRPRCHCRLLVAAYGSRCHR
ncbi:hypothetical protein Dimus_037285, partial [Dionaea muscipula]